jgi:hypothetical protein
MKKELAEKFVLNCQAFGMSVNQAAERLQAASEALIEFNNSLKSIKGLVLSEAKSTDHRNKCVLIAGLMDACDDPIVKNVLWNLFKNVKQ